MTTQRRIEMLTLDGMGERRTHVYDMPTVTDRGILVYWPRGVRKGD